MIILTDISPAFPLITFIIHFIHHSSTFIKQHPTTWLQYHNQYSHYSIQKNGQLSPITARPWPFITPLFHKILAQTVFNFISTIGNTFHWIILCYNRSQGPPNTTHHLHPSRWKIRQAFPSSWMILSCIMLTNYTASMFHCCDCYNIKSNLTIRLDFDNILRPHIMMSFIPLPSPYRWYDSQPVRQAMTLHK